MLHLTDYQTAWSDLQASTLASYPPMPKGSGIPEVPMTNGGPNNATLFFLLYLYQNAFQYFRMGYGSALAWVLFLYILVLTLLVQRSSNTWVYYEGKERQG